MNYEIMNVDCKIVELSMEVNHGYFRRHTGYNSLFNIFPFVESKTENTAQKCGRYILNVGVWLIWPTWTVFILNVFFIYTLEIQVRCEEDFLESIHGREYIEYKGKTRRYIPYVY